MEQRLTLAWMLKAAKAIFKAEEIVTKFVEAFIESCRRKTRVDVNGKLSESIRLLPDALPPVRVLEKSS